MTEIYSSEEVQQILQIAIQRQAEQGELSRQQLLEIAEELGISSTDLQVAENAWLERRDELNDKNLFAQERRQRFQQDLTKFLIVNSFLMSINFLATHHLGWSLYVLLGWGMGMTLTAWKTFQTDSHAYEQAFQRWRLKRQIGQSVKSLSSQWFRRLMAMDDRQ